jgi:hypothetical protein
VLAFTNRRNFTAKHISLKTFRIFYYDWPHVTSLLSPLLISSRFVFNKLYSSQFLIPHLAIIWPLMKGNERKNTMKHAYLGLSIGFAMLFALAMVVFQAAFAEAEWELVEPNEPANFYIMMPGKEDTDYVAEAADTTSNWAGCDVTQNVFSASVSIPNSSALTAGMEGSCGHDVPVEEETNIMLVSTGSEAIVAFAQPDNPVDGITP